MPRTPPSVLCRIETDPVAIFQFLQLNGYPTFWSPDRFTDGILAIRVMGLDRATLGYIWGSWTEPGRFGFHACAVRGGSLPFLGSDLVHQLCQSVFLVGGDEVVTNVDDHPDFKPLRRLLLRLGFTEVPRTDGGSDFALKLPSDP